MRGDIKGVVKDADGKSVDNCLISITPTGAAKITDSDGSFEFTRLDPGEYTITVKKEGYIEKTEKIVVLSGKVVDVDIVLSFAYGSIKGSVKDAEGVLVENCLISIYPGGNTILTGADGIIEFKDLTPGEYTLTFKKEGFADKTQKVTVVAGKTTDVEVTLGHAYGSIKGIVKESNGSMIENCLVTLTPGGNMIATGTNGSFEYKDLTPSEYTLTFKKDGFVDKTQKVTVVAGKVTDIEVTLEYAYGSIKGLVKDSDDGSMIENCLVSLTPGGRSVSTGANGSFEFNDLAPDEYTLGFKKTGYPDKSEKVSVAKGKVTNVDVVMKLEDPITFSENELDFGDFEMTKTLAIFNNSDGDCTFTISNIPSWLSISLTNGGISKQSQTTLVVTADRDKISYGKFEQNLIIAYRGRVSGEVMIKTYIEKVLLTTPEVTIYTEAENITETSFDIKGNIVATGGSQILDYGHCWSINEEPTIDDNCTRLGQRDNEGLFVSSITGLTSSSTYYVRAYARNAQGITYSEQIAVTTQSPYNNKWDGNIASAYAGGSGTSYDPYIIKTGGQLLYALKQGSGYLKLANDIDLNNHNWKPFSFSGTLDGDGHTIANLYIDREGEGVGLIGSLSGTVKNLTLHGVYMNGRDGGAISAGGGRITNCHVVLTRNSVIKCTGTVGGITGTAGEEISNCSVIAADNDVAYIAGGNSVGGIVGDVNYSIPRTISGCIVSCDIYGEESVGGICGYLQTANQGKGHTINNCSYQGRISGTRAIGGIAGTYLASLDVDIICCKVVANIEGDDRVGGIVGSTSGWGDIKFICCYTNGVLKCSNVDDCAGVVGFWTAGGATSVMTYTTMQSENGEIYPTGSRFDEDCYSINETDNIAQKMKEAYSDYAHYWNFDNTWTWTGIVDGKQKSVICPRLAWE